MDNNSTTMMAQQECDQMEKLYLEGLVRKYQDISLKLNEDYDGLKKRKRELDVESSAVGFKLQKALDDSAFAKELFKKIMFQSFCLMVKQNDPTIASLDDELKFVDGFDKGLGKALKGNTCITSISVFLDMLQKSDGDPSFIQFIQTSTSLTRVSLKGGCKCYQLKKSLVPSLLLATSSNACIIEVTIDFPISPEDLGIFMKNAKSVKRLTLGCVAEDWEDDEYRCAAWAPTWISDLPAAFGNNDTLKSLALTSFTPKLLPALKGLAAGQSKLCEFKLEKSYGEELYGWDTICQVFDSRHLQCLELSRIAFKTEMMETLTQCFTNNDHASAVLSKLSFRECKYTEGACTALVKFMQSKTGIHQGDSALALNQLSFDGDSCMCSLSYGSREASIGKFVCAMLVAEPKEGESIYIPTVGSLVQTLVIHHYGWIRERMLDGMRLLAHRIQIQSLELHGMNGEKIEELAQNLPHLTFLKSLHLGIGRHTPDTSRIVLQMLRENDHVCSFSILEQPSKDGEPILEAFQVQLAQAYCQRNSNLAGLRRHGPVCLYPRILQATKQVPRTKLTAVYQCLMTIGESSGRMTD
jgi:hypothetical protein